MKRIVDSLKSVHGVEMGFLADKRGNIVEFNVPEDLKEKVKHVSTILRYCFDEVGDRDIKKFLVEGNSGKFAVFLKNEKFLCVATSQKTNIPLLSLIAMKILDFEELPLKTEERFISEKSLIKNIFEENEERIRDEIGDILKRFGFMIKGLTIEVTEKIEVRVRYARLGVFVGLTLESIPIDEMVSEIKDFIKDFLSKENIREMDIIVKLSS